MSTVDDNEPQSVDAAQDNTSSSPGECLKQAREQAGLSPEQVAKDLFLDTQVIRAIEVDRFKDLGAPVYAKGYLRRYAKLVGLAEEDVLSRYQQLTDVPREADPIPVSRLSAEVKPQSAIKWGRWVALVVLIIAAVVILANLRESEDAVIQSAVVTTAVDSPLNNLPDETSVAAADVAAQAPVDSAASLSAASASTIGTVSLQLNFSGDSWVEIYDANNQQLLYDMGTANAVRQVSGVAPLRLTFGSASAVKLAVNGRDVAVPAAKVQSNVAHFNVNASGDIE